MKEKIFIQQTLKNIRKRINSFSWKIRISLLIVVFIVLVFVVKSVFFSGSIEKYNFDTVENGTVTQFVTVNGNVTAANATDVFSPTNGVLDEIFVENGDTVKKGDALFTVRSTAIIQEQASAFASYQSALNTLNTAQNAKLAQDALMWTKQQAYLNAQNEQNYKKNNDVNPATGRNYTNLEKLSIDSSVTQTQKDFAAAEQAYKTADIAIADGQAQVNAAYLAYQATKTMTIAAPVDGVIHNIIGLKGAKVEANNQSASTITSVYTSIIQTQSTGTVIPVLIIGNETGEYTIQTAVSEVYANKIKLGQRVTILFNGIVNKVYKGHVIQLDTFGTNTQGVITYNVFVAMDTIDQDIRQGMSAILTINAAERRDVLTAANGAIVTYEGKKAVQVLKENREVEFIPVKVGLRGNTRTEIISGIDEGTDIIIGNTEFMKQESGSFTLGE